MDEKDKIISVCLEFTDVCNVGCPYCLLENKKPTSTKESIFEILSILFKYGVKRFSLGGGEILQIPYVYEAGEFIKENNATSLLRTSACVPIDYSRASNSFDMIDISIDSIKLQTLKLCKPNIDGTIPLDNIKLLSEKNIPIRCNILITMYNYQDLFDTIVWLNNVGVKEIRLQKLVSRGRAKKIFHEISVPDSIFGDLVAECYNLGKKLDVPITVLETVNSQTLCIVKPDGTVYVGTPTGLLSMGSVFDLSSWQAASRMISKNQRKYYGEYYSN